MEQGNIFYILLVLIDKSYENCISSANMTEKQIVCHTSLHFTAYQKMRGESYEIHSAISISS
jgi:hypothetical protein